MEKYLDLNRKFGHLINYSSYEFDALGLRTKRLSWEQVLKGRYSVIVGRANFGKTSEFRAKNQAFREKGRASIFVALHRVLSENVFVDALETAEKEAYDAWKQNRGELVIFVDSLDEVALASRDGISRALRKVCNAVGAGSDVRWVLSARPAVLTDSVLNLLQQELRTTLFKKGEQSIEEAFTDEESEVGNEPQANDFARNNGVGEADAKGKVENKILEQDQLKIYVLHPLDRVAASLYLREHVGMLEPKETILAARRYGLARMIDSPGGLDILGYIDPVKTPPQSLTTVFEQISDAIQEQQRTDPREALLDDAEPEAFKEAIQRLAAASMVCGLPNIELSDAALQFQPGVLSARPILAPMLREASLKYLLGSRFFIDAGQQQVKLYPDELFPFLAAKRLAGLVKSPNHARLLLDNFSWKAPTGECGVNREFLTLAGWLSVFSTHCRKVLLDTEPQAVAFFGDLRYPGVSMHDATTALERSIKRLVDDGDSLGRRHFTLTTENYWQGMKPGLAPVLERLYQKYSSDISARDALLDIAGNAASDIFRDTVLDAAGQDYEKLLVDQLGLNYILSLGQQHDFDALATVLLKQPALPEDRIATVVSHIAWRSLNAKTIALLVVQQFERGRGGYSLDWALTSMVAENASEVELYSLIRSLTVHLINREIKRGRSSEEFRSDQKFVELVLDLLAVLVERSSVSVTKTVRLCLVVNRFMVKNYSGSADLAQLNNSLRGNKVVRLAFLRSLVHLTDKTSAGIMDGVFQYHSLYPLVDGDELELNEPNFTQLVERWKKSAENQRHKPGSARRKEQLVDENSRRVMVENLEGIRQGNDDKTLAWIGLQLSRTIRESRYGECNFSAFREAAGDQIADAICTGLSKLWRQRDPLSNETEPNSTFNLTVAGLQGLFLDLGDGATLPVLAKVEVQRAIRYAAFEISGYPKWFWKLVKNYGEIAVVELLHMFTNSGRGAVSMAHAETLVRNLDDAPSEIQRRLAQAAWDFVRRTPSVGEYTVKMALKVAAANAVIEQADLESEALRLMEKAFGEEMPAIAIDNFVFNTDAEQQAPQQKINELMRLRNNAVTWGGLWLCTYPRSFSEAWQNWSDANKCDAQDFMLSLAVELGEERGARLMQVTDKGSEGFEVLKKLYHWTHSIIKIADDPERERFRVYSPTQRDHAQALRDAIVPAISYAKSEKAYQILEEIRLSSSGTTSKYLRYMQFMMREEQYPRNQIEQRAYIEFERNLASKVSSYISFAMAVENDLLTVKSQIETGDFSLRRFFNGINFDRIKTDNDGLALEDDFQSLLGSELNHASRGRYSVALESVLPGGTRRDVLCQMDDYKATIELKMSERWTVNDYIEALERQLQGQYMMAENSKIGFFVIVLQKKTRTWKLPDGKRIGFNLLLEHLQKRARDKEATDSALFLRVIGIDASTKVDFRQEHAANAGSAKYAIEKGNEWSGRG
ncbi:hypothetical protein ACO0LD_09150 [Undibacterium sp. Ji83W]|uniref:hypothetical protein n=1 Tax=Undibacterium sp. Ji83W TaxID=3413043 RepID=UPI003BEFE3A7